MHAPDTLISSAETLLAPAADLSAGEEARWVAAAAEGDAESTLRLLTRYRPPLVRLLAGVLGDWGAAEDLAQDAFLHAFRSLDQLRDRTRFYPWVRRSAVRLAVKWLRGRREVSLETGGAEPVGADPSGVVETRLVVDEILALLPTEQRITLVLREMEGMDYAEIAAELGIPVGTVRSRLFAAREQFRKLWTERQAG